MNFTPKSEKELSEENLFPAGIYPFEILEATDKTSKKGNDMIELKLRVFHGERHQIVNDYLLESIGYKLRHAAVTLPDPKKGEQVVLLSEAPEAARTPILSWAQSHGVPEISVPRRVFRVAQIPVLGTGKVDYSAVRTEAERLMND